MAIWIPEPVYDDYVHVIINRRGQAVRHTLDKLAAHKASRKGFDVSWCVPRDIAEEFYPLAS